MSYRFSVIRRPCAEVLRPKGLIGFLCFLALLGVFASATLTSPSFDRARQDYAAQVRKTYNFHFGQNTPFLPSYAQIEGNDFIPSSAFPTASYCGHCHAGAYQQWRQSLHSNSFRAPFYKKNADLLADTKGIEYTRHCEGCHNPVALFSGAVTQNSHIDRSFDEDGLTCSVCHSIEKLQAPYGTGSYVMGVPAVMVDERGNPIPGTVPDAEILAHPDRHSKAVMKDFYRSPEFCGACHFTAIPRILSDYKWLRGFSTYDEWQASAFSKRSPLPYYQRAQNTCQGCHMAPEAVPNGEYGAKNGAVASHRWLGGNTAVPFYYGYMEQLEKTEAFLRNQTLNVDIFALKKPSSLVAPKPGEGGPQLIAPLGTPTASPQLAPNDDAQVFVVIQNKGLGHSLIPEQRDMYEAWVEFTVTDAGGAEIMHSGFLKPDGSLDEHAHSFTNRLVGKDGKLLVQHEIWNRRAVAFDNTIQSGRSALVRYQFHVPPDAKGPLTVTARVNYRHFNQEFTDYILGPAPTGRSHAQYPVVEMASQTRSLALATSALVASASLPANLASVSDPPDNPDWLRWNNFGIALVDQQQYSDAINAFEHVIKLRPDYADAYTNVALTDLAWEKFSLAHDYADKALHLSPGNPRALYYRALIERNQNALGAATADLEQVVKQVPESRDALRELGVSHFLEHQDAPAREEFEAVQAIAPDDLLCHYYLAILYRRLGMKDKADQQAALYADKREDPQTSTTALAFLLTSPEANNETVPAHVHSAPTRGSSTALARH